MVSLLGVDFQKEVKSLDCRGVIFAAALFGLRFFPRRFFYPAVRKRLEHYALSVAENGRTVRFSPWLLVFPKTVLVK